MKDFSVTPCAGARGVLWAVWVLFCLLFLHPEFSFAEAQVEASPRLVTIGSHDLPGFFSYIGGVKTGFGVELCREIARRAGDDVRFESATWGEVLNHARTESNYGALPAARAKNREAHFKWVGPLLFKRYWLFTHHSNKKHISSLAEARNAEAIAVVRGSFLEHYLVDAGFTNIISLSDPSQCLRELGDGRVDYIVSDEEIVDGLSHSAGYSPSTFRPDFLLYENPSYIAFSLKTPCSVSESWQRALGEMKRDGTYRTLFRAWFSESKKHFYSGGDARPIVFSPQERLWLREHKVVRVALDPGFPPFEFWDRAGRPAGMATDYLSLVSRMTGVQFRYVRTGSWLESVELLRRREADILPAMLKTEPRMEYVAFSSPYQHSIVVAMTRTEHPFRTRLDEFRKERLAVVKGYALLPGTEQLRKREYRNIESALNAVSTGEADFYIGNLASVSHVARSAGLTNLKVSCRIGRDRHALRMGIRKDWADFAGIISKVMSVIPVQEQSSIYDRWVRLPHERPVSLNSVLWWVIRLGVPVLCVFLLLWWRNSRLRHEICDRKAAEAALRESEQRLSMALDSPDYGLWELLIPSRELHVPERLFQENLGYLSYQVPSNSAVLRKMLHPKDLILLEQRLNRYLTGLDPEFSFEFRIANASGHWMWLHIMGRVVGWNSEGNPSRLLGLCTDITSRKELEDRMREQVTTDCLTQVSTRRHFFDLGHREIARAKRERTPVGVLMIDADHFKQVNDRLGHAAGDTALRTLAAVGRELVRDVDLFGRLGGEEFAVILPGAGLEDALNVAERLRREVENRVSCELGPLGRGMLKFTISIGVASSFGGEETLDSLLSRADVALYEAKKAGRNAVRCSVTPEKFMTPLLLPPEEQEKGVEQPEI